MDWKFLPLAVKASQGLLRLYPTRILFRGQNACWIYFENLRKSYFFVFSVILLSLCLLCNQCHWSRIRLFENFYFGTTSNSSGELEQYIFFLLLNASGVLSKDFLFLQELFDILLNARKEEPCVSTRTLVSVGCGKRKNPLKGPSAQWW